MRWCLLGILLISVVAANACLFLMNGGATTPTRGPFYYNGAGGQLRLDLAPARVGMNRFLLRLRDEDGRLLGHARLRLVLVMPAMAAMGMPMAPLVLWAVPTKAGGYLGSGILAMSGRWEATVMASGQGLLGQGLQVTFPITIGT